jgi:HTH-type transcriptional regulator/antitoxin HigA
VVKKSNRIERDVAVHPGEFLAEEIQARGLSQKALAEEMGRPVQVVNEIIRGKKAITAETALDLEAALGLSARFWLNFQVEHDLTAARLRRGNAA